ncbi:reco: DNA repair protein RecO [Rubrobacter radiotolerans]|uniref:DNA repair protein RecO n=1 Tax=Rubrobacter radiotolerans TaxID=42256 RepID=A0A023X409_RUBRA|nr:DNA repair protein RecO [Rubrobacter radiotolerans]AHY46794.1 reco: DNA repair protein RecO [Rubrobacter radiotolerans]MDX5894201.1 DNA repair protein RecO [Rubrobacter radiotolerans]SMC05460.1 DNA replication and repair protein RecO [Rubrobacter radiotolerans DSM 5868]
MAVYRSRGIVLRSIRYGEADRILDLYTTDRGLVSAIVKGIRRTKSRFGARLEPLSCVEFLAYEGRSLDTLTQSETLRSFKGVREDLSRFETAARMVGYVRALSGGDEADRRVFNLLFHALDLLEKENSDNFGPLEAAFGIKLSILAGYAPQFDLCAICEGDPEAYGPERPARFAPDLGGVVCAECAVASRDSFALPPGSPGALLHLVRSPLREAERSEASEGVLLRVVRTHVAANAPSGSAVGVASRDAV